MTSGPAAALGVGRCATSAMGPAERVDLNLSGLTTCIVPRDITDWWKFCPMQKRLKPYVGARYQDGYQTVRSGLCFAGIASRRQTHARGCQTPRACPTARRNARSRRSGTTGRRAAWHFFADSGRLLRADVDGIDPTAFGCACAGRVWCDAGAGGSSACGRAVASSDAGLTSCQAAIPRRPPPDGTPGQLNLHRDAGIETACASSHNP